MSALACAWLALWCSAAPAAPAAQVPYTVVNPPRPADSIVQPAFTTTPGAPRGVPVEAVQYRRTIQREAEYYWGLSAPTATFFGQLHQESNFRATARSKFAAGIAQFTPQTAAGMQQAYPDLRVLCPVAEGCPLEPGWAIKAMVLYDRGLWRGRADAVAGDERLAFMLADYNGGAGWVNRERKSCAAAPAEGQLGGCAAAKYFRNVQAFCGRSEPARAGWACKENTRYPTVILLKWRPLYAEWVRG